MKSRHANLVAALLLVVTAVVVGWSVVLVVVGVDILGMLHMAAPSSPAYRTMLNDVCADAQKLLCAAVIPLVAVIVLWLWAFLYTRREYHRLLRTLRETASCADGGGIPRPAA